MEKKSLDAEDFANLRDSDSGAFLPWSDAISEIKGRYTEIGLADCSGTQRIVRPVVLPAGFKLFKLTRYKTLRDPLSPWWSSVCPYEENELGAREAFMTALLNGVSLREFIRFISAVSLDWNLLEFYVEIQLQRSMPAFWGQFSPQAGIQNPNASIGEVSIREQASEGGDNTMVQFESDKGAGSEAYLPGVLGGFGAWQLYVPNFHQSDLMEESLIAISSVDNTELGQHLGVSNEEMQKLESRF